MKLRFLVIPVLIMFTTGCQQSLFTTDLRPAPASEPIETAVPETTATTSAPVITASAHAQQVKEYILYGQQDLPAAGQINWSPAFLELVNIDAMYQDYLNRAGDPDDLTAFVRYLADYAPIPQNWQELFAADLLHAYGYAPTRYEPLGDDLYQVYVMIEQHEVPYVVVFARTGDFHG